MSEHWKTVPVSQKVRESMWRWAEWAADKTAEPFALPPLGVYAAARQFREDVLAADNLDTTKEGNAGRGVCRAVDEYAAADQEKP